MADDGGTGRDGAPGGTMRVWRLTAPDRAPGLDGAEGRQGGGRWTSPGHPAVYTATSLPLAILESWVHVPADKREPGALPEPVAVCLDVPADAIEVAHADPRDRAAARRLGDGWARSGRSLGLVVPSVVAPSGRNVILNADHPRMAEVWVVSVEPCPFDPRLAAPDG